MWRRVFDNYQGSQHQLKSDFIWNLIQVKYSCQLHLKGASLQYQKAKIENLCENKEECTFNATNEFFHYTEDICRPRLRLLYRCWRLKFFPSKKFKYWRCDGRNPVHSFETRRLEENSSDTEATSLTTTTEETSTSTPKGNDHVHSICEWF